MLGTFRRGADGFLAKLLLGFLVLSFGLWGIGDVFRGAPDNAIAIVNDQAISLNDLEAAIRNEQARYPEMTAEVAQSLPVRLQVLNRMINTRLLEAEAKSIGIDFTEEALSKHIADDPMFKDTNGAFNRDIFLNLLRQNNLSQGMFLHQIESDLRINLLNGVIANSISASAQMAELYYHIYNEERDVSLLLISANDIGSVPTPSIEEMQQYYERAKEDFREPEYRTYRYVYFDADMVAKNKNIAPSDDEIRSYYDQQYQNSDAGKKPDFETAKEPIRQLLAEEQLTSKLTELSNLLDDSVAGGATLEEALAAAGLSDLKIETLGPISLTNQLKNGESYPMKPFEQEILATAFDQVAGDISPITVSSDNHYYLSETLEIVPSQIPDYAAVQAKIENQLLQKRKEEKLIASAGKLATDLKQAESPKALAQEQGYSLHSTGKIKRYHDTVANNSQLKDKILPSDLVLAAFSLKPNEVSEPFVLPSGEMAIAILNAIHPAPKPDTEALESTRKDLNQQLRMQALTAYLSALRDKYKVELFIDKIVSPVVSQ